MAGQTTFRLPSKGAGYRKIEESVELVPQVQAHEVLLNVKAAALNYRDLAIANGTYPFPAKNDLVPLSDGAGIIAQVGKAVEDFAVGDRAIVNLDTTNLYGSQEDWDHGLGGSLDGMLRDYVAVPATAAVKIPKHTTLTWPQLASLVCTGTTVWNALYGNTPLKPGQTVLLQGTGGVSMTGLLLAKAAGARTIITSSSDEKLRIAIEEYGADHAINYKTTPDWAAAANELTEGRGVDFVLENGGSGTIAQSISCIRPGGIVAVIGFLSQAEIMPDVTALILGKGCVVRGINIGSKQMMEELASFVCARGLAIPVQKTFGFSLDGVVQAYEYLEAGGHMGKVCIEF